MLFLSLSLSLPRIRSLTHSLVWVSGRDYGFVSSFSKYSKRDNIKLNWIVFHFLKLVAAAAAFLCDKLMQLMDVCGRFSELY